MYLLDTNILSELRKREERRNEGVWNWFQTVESRETYISVLTIGEIRKGIEVLKRRDPNQARVFEVWLRRLRSDYSENILSIDDAIADKWGELQAVRPVAVVDGLIAASAIVYDFTLVTRNESDFDGLGVNLLNPFSG